jgi:predicted nuclease of predicted toxin-antitoxin system
MKVLLDECLPRKLGRLLVGHEVTTVQEAGRSGVSNGKLLARVAGQFGAFITIDQNLSAQQDTAALPFGIIVLRSRTNQLHDLAPLAPQILSALPMLLPGRVLVIGSPG